MFDTPFDRYHDEAAAERRGQEQFDEREQDGGYDPAEVTARQPKSRLMRVWIGVLIVLAAITAWWGLGGGAPAPAAAPLPVVTVATPLQKEITEWDEFVGRFEASRRVEVRPQVSGQITAIHFTDGQFVRQGAPLFTIDARTYRASLAQAQAQVAQATTALALSRDNLARAQRLVEDDAVAANEIDRLKAEVRNNEAGLAAALRSGRGPSGLRFGARARRRVRDPPPLHGTGRGMIPESPVRRWSGSGALTILCAHVPHARRLPRPYEGAPRQTQSADGESLTTPSS